MRATHLLHQDHEAVNALFGRFAQLPQQDGAGRQQLFDQIADELEVHASLEEEIFYPALRRVSDRVEEAGREHAEVKRLIGEIEGQDPASPEFDARVMELKRLVLHHVGEEEGPLFMDAARLGPEELDRLGREMAERQEALKTSLLQRGMRAAKRAARKIA
ncbi:MAG TPA: hemerythrin domain-containing protein [Candidatus Binatia bacterium]|nr:hemerythrin domain-containing protein [Candidatus Binatia bacterium]